MTDPALASLTLTLPVGVLDELRTAAGAEDPADWAAARLMAERESRPPAVKAGEDDPAPAQTAEARLAAARLRLAEAKLARAERRCERLEHDAAEARRDAAAQVGAANGERDAALAAASPASVIGTGDPAQTIRCLDVQLEWLKLVFAELCAHTAFTSPDEERRGRVKAARQLAAHEQAIAARLARRARETAGDAEASSPFDVSE